MLSVFFLIPCVLFLCKSFSISCCNNYRPHSLWLSRNKSYNNTITQLPQVLFMSFLPVGLNLQHFNPPPFECSPESYTSDPAPVGHGEPPDLPLNAGKVKVRIKLYGPHPIVLGQYHQEEEAEQGHAAHFTKGLCSYFRIVTKTVSEQLIKFSIVVFVWLIWRPMIESRWRAHAAGGKQRDATTKKIKRRWQEYVNEYASC